MQETYLCNCQKMINLSQEQTLSLSVVIPTIGRLEVLLSTLEDLSKQDLERWECLIIAQHEIDSQPVIDLANRTGSKIRLFYCSEPNASLARNIGLLEAKGDVVLFLDDDLEISSSSFLKAHLKNYDDPLVKGVAGQILGAKREIRTSRHSWSYRPHVGWLYFPLNYNERCKVTSGASCNLSIRRKEALAVGGMDAQFERGAHREESDFCLRFVKKYGSLIFDPEASVIHLQASAGGCRTWGENKGVHPLHHVVGEWYFIIKNFFNGNIAVRELPDHLFVLVRRQIWNQHNKWKFSQIISALVYSLKGFQQARVKLKKGERYIHQITPDTYLTLD